MKTRKVNGYWMHDDRPGAGGVMFQVSWPNFEKAMRDAGFLKADEDIDRIEADPVHGMMIRVEKRT